WPLPDLAPRWNFALLAIRVERIAIVHRGPARGIGAFARAAAGKYAAGVGFVARGRVRVVRRRHHRVLADAALLTSCDWGPDLVSSSGPGESTTTIPSGVAVALFATIGTWAVAKYGLARGREG